MKKHLFILFAGLALGGSSSIAQFNTLDLSFNSTDGGFQKGDGFGGSVPYVYALAKQSDGKILAGGGFSVYNGRNIPPGLVRFNTDGSVDNSFQPTTGVAAGPVRCIAVQTDGKILIGGSFSFYNGSLRLRLARINSNGSIDNSFNANLSGDQVNSIAIMPSGKIIIGGTFNAVNGIPRANIAILNPDGSLFSSFNPGSGTNSDVHSIIVQNDKKILIGGRFSTYNGNNRSRLARVDSTGILDSGFNPDLYYGPDGAVYSILLQTDQKPIVGGSVNYNFPHHGDPTPRSGLVRLNQNGSNDNSFSHVVEIPDVRSIIQQNDGKIIAGGIMGHGPNVYFFRTSGSSLAHTKYWQITRVMPDGTLDLSFGPYGVVGANSVIHTLIAQDDGKVLGGGEFTTFNFVHRSFITRLTANGDVDLTFNPPSGSNATIMKMALQNDGKVLIGGYITSYNGQKRIGIARILPDGSLDETFDPGRGPMDEAQRPSPVLAIAVQNSGKILVGGYFSNFNEPDNESNSYIGPYTHNITRLNIDGSIDNSFSHPLSWSVGQRINSIVLQPDGKILIAGRFRIGSTLYGVARLNENGSVDPTFLKGTTNDIVNTLAVDANGKILVGGHFSLFNNSPANHIVRLNQDGAVDNTFNTGTGPSDQIHHFGVQADGKLLVGGDFNFFNGSTSPGILRLNTDGSFDNSFSSGFTVSNSHAVRSIMIQQSGKILVSGEFTSYGNVSRNRIVRINTNGTIDLTFNPCTGASSTIQSLLLTPNERKLYIAGSFASFNNCGKNRVARIFVDPQIGFAQSVCYNTAAQTLNTDLTTGGLDCNNYSFQWQRSTDGANFTDIQGANSESYVPGQLTNNTWYRRNTIGVCGTTTSNAVAITVYPPLSGNIIQGEQSICHNTSPTVISTVTPAAGGNGPFTHQWEKSLDGTTYEIMQGETNEDLSPGNLVTTTWYRRKATNTCGTITSNAIRVLVYTPLAGNIIGGEQAICHNSSPNIIQAISPPTGGNGPFSYQWQVSQDGNVFVDINGETGETFTPPSLTSSTWYRQKATNSCGVINSNVIMITVYPALTGNHIQSDQTICINTIPLQLTTQTLPGGGNNLFSYQWQSSSDGQVFSDINNANTEVLSLGSLSQTTHYRRVATNLAGCGFLVSNIVVITVTQNVTAGTITGDSLQCSGGSAQFLSSGSPGGSWTSSHNSVATVNASGLVSAITEGTALITYTVTSGCGSPASSSRSIQVINCNPCNSNPRPLISSLVCSPGSTIPVNSTITLTVNYSDNSNGGPYTIDIDWNDGSPHTILNVANSTATVYSISASHLYSMSAVFEPRVRVTDGCGLISDVITGVSTWQYLAVYVTDNDFTTMGGWFNTPAGSLNANPSFTGRVNMGNIVRPNHSNNKGELEMEIHGQNFRVHTVSPVSWDYLTISNCCLAIFKGTVRINNSGLYKILVAQTDRNISCQSYGGNNKIRVKIWNHLTNEVFFDTQPGDPDNAIPTLSLGGGSVQVHKQVCNITVRTRDIENERSPSPLSGLMVKFGPNPSEKTFTLHVASTSEELISVRILDVFGRELLALIMRNDETVSFGDNLKSGMYIAEICQGSNRKRVKLIRK